MKKSIRVALLLIFASFTSFTFAQKSKFSFNEVYKVSDSPSLEVTGSDGNIAVFPSEKNEIEVFFIVERNKEVLDITRSELEEEFTIEISSGKDFLRISVKERFQYRMIDWRDRINVSFEIYTPFKTMTDLHTSDGNIDVRGLIADQKLYTSDGNIYVSKINGRVNARTSDGDIIINRVNGDVEPVTSDGDIELTQVEGNVDGRTSDGDADIRGVKGDVNMVTSDGNLTGEDIIGDAKLRSSDGDIRLLQSNGKMTLNTSDGNITFRDLKGSLSARTSDGQIKGNMLRLDDNLELRTSDGGIAVTVPNNQGLDLLLRGETIRTQLDNFSGTAKDHLVEGQIRGGGKLVSLHASDGTVSLSYME
ncbi:MAG: DUF4097 family beta strand repeat-containing protein [Reichenbachiella sp.]|uniref:DUF4097 family beta strand repeat-containing protein n=1 Tax=Reichenbachiella sp. TaxID=2184521 RepID=UPI0032661939